MNAQPDNLLLLQLKRGDLHALEAVYRRFQPVLLAKAVFMMRDHATAADLVQGLFIEFWEKQLYQQIEDNLGGYLYRALHNRCLNALKAQQTQHERIAGYHEQYTDYDDAPDVEIGLEKGAIARLMDQLPPQKREVLTLVVLEDRKYQEAADIMGISVNTIKTHLRLALQQLREQVKNQRRSPDNGEENVLG
ncbi:RNA polymerase sigma factor [Parapedobacter sp. ISTM3]|uniref:RNA polymerase sigma factor n=1 Tax=Parapedobacter sp. ISTM3 TaxID=2800130 RepID=UPI0019045A3C|nr:RNA polymerase sigma factor [Parapedobacter sp. ISTM3]MBK1440975.1 RNA polymerase sigma factor [Parapedobacter sp. ISTM3]